MKAPRFIIRDVCTTVLTVAAFMFSHSPAWSDPRSLDLSSAVYDAPRQRMLVFGGSPGPPAPQEYSNTCWALGLGAAPQWDSLTAAGPAPSPRVGGVAVYDPVGEQMIVFGGYDGANYLGDAWSLSLAGTPAWNELFPTGFLPSPRSYSSAIYDPVRDRVLVFGGRNQFIESDVWSLRLRPTPVWELVAVNGAPPSNRISHSAVYDRRGDRMLVFGGFNVSNDLWALTLGDATWTTIQALGPAPGPRLGHAAICDPVSNRMIVFGGNTLNTALNDIWACPLTGALTWTPLVVSGTAPSPRRYLTAIYDSTYQRMVLFGGDPGITDPTWTLSLATTPRWSPFPPVVHTSSDLLSFPAVTRGDALTLPLVITNAGLQQLAVSGLQLPMRQVQADGFVPTLLASGDSVVLAVSLIASALGHIQDSLVILSTDPLTPRKRVMLDIDVHEFEFDTRPLGIPAQAPLGVALNIVVTPKTGTRIDRGALYYRGAGVASGFDSLALAPLAADFIATIPALAVTERGIEYYVRVEHNGFSETQPGAAPDTLFAQLVAPPASLAAIPQTTSGADYLAGRDIRIETVLPLGASFVSGALHYRRGGDSVFTVVPLGVTGHSEHPSAVVPADEAGPRGVEYWVGVQTLTTALRFPVATGAVDVVPIRVQDLREPVEHVGGRYRLLSVPLDFGSDFSSSIDALLVDQFGSYDPVRWRAYAYDPQAGANVELSAVPALFAPIPGRALWLVTRGAHRVDTHPIDGFSTTTRAEYALPLQPGWNLFGNPFDFPVAWSAVRHSMALGAPVRFDPSTGRQGDYAALPPAVLEPFEGYFIENSATVPETLWVSPVSAAGAASSSMATPSTETAGRPAGVVGVRGGGDARDVWRLRLRATTDVAVDGSNEFGINTSADSGFDALDLAKPPLPPGPWVRVAFAHPEWGRTSASYRHDLRPPGAEGEAWEIEVRSGSPGEPVTLDLTDVIATTPGLPVRLVDRELGSAVDLLPLGPVTGGLTDSPRLKYQLVSFGPKPYRLTLLTGTAGFIARASEAALSIPLRFSVEPNAPNPFLRATRIRFGTPTAARVSAEVYSVSGQRVATLLDSAEFAGGYHSVVWDGTAYGGRRAASGVYLLRLSAGGEIRTLHLVLVR